MSDYIKREDAEEAIKDLFRPLEWLMPYNVSVENIGEKALRRVRSYDVVALNTKLDLNDYGIEIEDYASGKHFATIRWADKDGEDNECK